MTLECKVEILNSFTKFMSFLVNLRKSELYSFYKQWYCFRFDHMTAMYFTDHPFTYIISVQPVGYTLGRWVDEDFCLY